MYSESRLLKVAMSLAMHGWSKSPSTKRSFMICFCMFSTT